MKEYEAPMDHPVDALSEYLDDTLAAEQRRAVEAHLAACASCASTLDELRLVLARASALVPEAPELDLWPAIEARLEPRRAGLGDRIAGWISRHRVSLSFPQLAGAMAAMALVAAGVTWVVSQRSAVPVAQLQPSPSRSFAARPPDSSARETPEPEAPRRVTPHASATFAEFDQKRYDAAIDELQRVLHDHRDELDTTTVRILEQNLALIDRATEDARRALEADPANPYLNGHLAQQMRLKVRLLQRAAEVVAAHS